MIQRERQIERLFHRHYRAMYRVATMLLHDADESKDIVHDVFVRLLTDPVDLREDTAQSYLLLCVRNRCLNTIRSRDVHERVRQYLLLDEDLEQTSPEEFEREIEALRKGVEKLFPPIGREIILSHFVQGLTFGEIAKQMGVSETTIYKHLRRALDQLSQTLKNSEQ